VVQKTFEEVGRDWYREVDARQETESNPTTENTGTEEEEAPSLVFRESEYYDLIANPTCFANYTANFESICR
jgi:hypothetical protein